MKNQYVTPSTENVQLDPLMVTFGEFASVSYSNKEYNGEGF